MSLQEYKKKRDLSKTPEPKAAVKHSADGLHFCVQKHYASHLHYDFRLECQGVLLSWAVPKGPSTDPKDKRLAIHVEDHPLEYQYFEGTIPKGNYGAGKVERWDWGTFTVPHAETRKEEEKTLAEGLKKGHINIEMHGKKLEGAFTLQKLKSDPDDKSWLLIKKESAPKTRKASKKKAEMPPFFTPMLATLVSEPFDGEDWLFEVKWDGFRALAFIDAGNVLLKSRNDNLLNPKFSSVVENLKKINRQVVLDGELVILDKEGKSDFQLMQNYQSEGEGNVFFYVFDIVFLDGEDLRDLPLIERKEKLQKFLSEYSLPRVRYSDHVIAKGKALFHEASKKHLEGIVGKKASSIYQTHRSTDWVKIKTSMRQEVVIGGFTEPRGSRKKFGAVLLGVYNEKKELEYVGHVGGGFNQKLLEEVYKKLEPLKQEKSPFIDKKISTNTPVTWVKPKLICEVSFSEWTHGNHMRHPVFQGLRMDKPPKSVKKEVAEKPKQLGIEKTEIPGLTLTNLDKIFWPKEKYTKGDLINYYKIMAPYVVHYLKDRPITLHRYPNGIDDKEFYQKDFKFKVPEGIPTYKVHHEDGFYRYLGVNDLKALMYMVNLGCIDLHPFMSRYDNLENPDYCLIDLDPHDVTFKDLIEAALMVHKILDEVKVDHYCKTSGSKGIHIMIPFNGKYSYEQSRQFAEVICYYVHKELPYTTSMERSPEKRPNRIYLDCLQNRFGQTVVPPYSVRPKPKATVSTPLEWSEVTPKLDISSFTMKTIPARVKEIGDLFKPVLGKGVNLQAALKRISSTFS